MSPRIHGVKSAADQFNFFRQAVEASGSPLEMAKIAMLAWVDAGAQGVDHDHREAFAASFAACGVLDTLFTKMSEAGEITPFEREKLATWTAEAAWRDLENMTKTSTSKWMGNIKDTIAQGLKDSRVRGALGGAVVGGAVGAAADKDDRLRGAAMYALPGAALGGLAGHAHHEWKGLNAEKAKEMAEKAKEVAESIAPRREALTNMADLDEAIAPALSKLKPSPETTPMTGFGSNAFSFSGSLQPRTSTREPTPGNLLGGTVSAKIDDLGNAATKHMITSSPEIYHKRSKQASLHEKLADIVSSYADPAQQAQAPQPPPQPGADLNAPPAQGAGDPNEAPETIGDPGAGDAGMLDELMKSQKTIDNMIFLAQQVNMPELAQDLNAQREQLSDHFAAGNGYLPAELQHHFPKSEHAEQFMKKYKQRFGSPVPGKSSGTK